MKTCLETILAADSAVDGEAPWLAERRRAARDVLRTQGLPTVRNEHWKYTSLAHLDSVGFRVATAEDAATLTAAALAELEPQPACASRAVIVNGALRSDLGQLPAPQTGVRVRSLAEVLANEPERVGAALDAENTAAFTALNTATLSDGVLIEVGEEAGDEAELLLQFVGTGTQPVLRAPRVVVLTEPGARLRLVEQYLSSEGEQGLTNVVTNVAVAQGASVHHYRLQNEAVSSAHVGRIVADVEENGAFASDSVCFGGGLTRVDIDVRLRAAGASCQLNGLFVGDGERHIDHHTTIEHLAGDTHSTELYRGILDDSSRGVFNGRVVVHKDAQRITARQASNNLLLSRKAEIDTKPELEIYADDVSCAHGATVGELDLNQLFYLRSRGIDEATARAMLIYAFAESVVESIPIEAVRQAVASRFLGADPQDLIAGIDA